MLVSGLISAAGLALVISSAMDPTYSRTVLPLVGGLFFWISVFLLVPSLAGGLALLRGKEWGRIVIILVSLELLIVLPVGTALGIFGLWALLRPGGRIAFPAPAPSASIRVERQPDVNGLLLAMGGVAAGFLIVIGGGYLVFGGAGIGVPPGALAGSGVAIGVAVGVLYWRRAGPKPVHRQLPVQEPVVTPPSPACAHLQPIESTMRAAGIAMGANPSRAACRIHLKSLERRFGPLGPVTYSEYFQPERHAEDHPTGCLACTQCDSRLYTLHPFDCSPSTPWFPASPPALTRHGGFDGAATGSITAISVSPSGRIAAVASGSSNQAPDCVLWDVARREPLCRFPLPGLMRALAWTPDERSLIAGRGVPWTRGPGNRGPSLFVFDVPTGAERRRFGNELFGVRGIAVSPDGRMLLVSAMHGETGADGSSLLLWDLASGGLTRTIAQVGEGAAHGWLPYFTGVAFTPDGRFLAAGCDRYNVPPGARRITPNVEPPWWWGRGVRIWAADGMAEVDLLRHYGAVEAIGVSGDGRRLLASGERFGVWSLEDGHLLWDRPGATGHPAAMSPDGRMVARGLGYREDNHGPYVDAATEVYDAATGEFLALGWHRTPPSAMAFLPGPASARAGLLAGEEEGELRLWGM